MTHHRRTFLATVGALGIAGCLEELPDQLESDEEERDELQASNPDEPAADDADREEEEPEEDEEGARPDEAELLFDFREIHEWDLVDGDLSPDREEYVSADVAARLGGEADVLRIERSGLDLDLTGHRLSIVSRLHASEPSQAVDLIATDAEGNDMRFRTRFYKTGEETEFMPLDLGIYEWDDGVDLSAIDTLRIQSRFGAEASGTLWVDSIHLMPVPETPKLMIQWDDGFESQYTEAFPIQREYDVPATTFVNTANLDNGRLSVEQLTELQESGWEVSSHLMRHDNLRELSEQEQEVQIRAAREWLVDNGFEEGSQFFAYPYGEYDQSSYDLVREHHTYAMVGGDPGYGFPRSPAHVGRSGERSFEDAQAYIDTLVEFGGIGALFWHEVPGETPVAEFDRIMSYVHKRREAGELDVITLSDLAELQR